MHPFSCTFRDELNFSRWIGEPILIANVREGLHRGYFALGKLNGFSNNAAGETIAHISDIRTFPSTIEFAETPVEAGRMAELSDDAYQRIIDSAIGMSGLNESTGDFHTSVPIGVFADQLRRQQRGICSFSGAFTENGTVYPIQPLHQGGRWHASNFLFLDPEPGKLFLAFAWTLGPNLELLLDASAVVAGLAETVPAGGKLALSDAISARPDADAIKWHREQFLARLREGEQR